MSHILKTIIKLLRIDYIAEQLHGYCQVKRTEGPKYGCIDSSQLDIFVIVVFMSAEKG
jgi:hypothetical protein